MSRLRAPNPRNAPYEGNPPGPDNYYTHFDVTLNDRAKQHYMPWKPVGIQGQYGFVGVIPGSNLPLKSPRKFVQGDAPLELQPTYSHKSRYKS